MGTTDNTFNHSGDGEQNIGQGNEAIGKQINAQNAQIGVLGNHAHVEGGIHYHQPPPTPPPVIPRQLQPLDACFLGRDKELADLLEQLQPGKVVAVCGPGGMGKSALAAQAVDKLEKARFPDGIVFHSFYGHPQTEQALQAICVAFQVEAKTGLASTVRQVLSGRKALIILDGTEEADDLKAVLDLRSTCGVLITSRKRDDAQGFRLDLTPLEEQPAAEVFRLHSKGTARCAPTTTDDASVQGICKILDGWPVGLRIAGRYLSSTGESAADYLKWLEKEPFKELGDGTHQEENAALLLRRSVAQVSEDARLALGVAGTLAFAPIAREPVAAVLEDDERRARKALGELVNYGLLEKQEERWQISHALVHTYARTELALSRKNLLLLSDHYKWFCVSNMLPGRKGYVCTNDERGHHLRFLEACLNNELWDEVSDFVYLISRYLDRQGHWVDRQIALKIALTAARHIGGRRDEAWCLNSLGYTCGRCGDHKKALEWYEKSLPIYRELGDKQGEGATLNNIAKSHTLQEGYDLALHHFKQSLKIWREIRSQEGEGTTLNNIANVYMHQDEWEIALVYLEEALPIRWAAGDKIGAGETLNNIAAIYHSQENHNKAMEYLEQALVLRRQSGDRVGEAVTYFNIGLTYKDILNLVQAEKYLTVAVQIADWIDYPLLEKWREELAQVRAARQGTQET
ncbi:MAG: tetratricopeptide repeat protein [Candidatus Electrothrix sp. GW3-4]|uniref:tetratricopeptide repeat protein n=1 Tax=Candidatus Electrothrix sp. GW3-4 TaxID=3126740 RepID=UPI0030D4E319